MELKRSREKPWLLVTVNKLWSGRTSRRLIILLCIFLAFALGYTVHRAGFSVGNSFKSLKSEGKIMPLRIQALIARPEIEHIDIDINHVNFMRLAYQREIALSRGILTSSDADLVPATIRHNGETVRVKLRLKGDSTDHLKGDKWSFRIDVNGENTMFGMEQFSIHHPGTRNYLYEWLFHQALEYEGLVALRYDFIDVTLNGKDLGVYALEEHFDKRLIENNQSREGPIVRFDEDLLWADEFQYPERDGYYIANTYLPMDIDSYQTNKLLSEPSSYAQHMRAIYLLEAFRRGDLQTSEVFNIQKLASFYAVADLMGAQHSINTGNMRFYYNPLTSRLEPIGFDGDSGKRIRALSTGLAYLVDPVYIETIFNDLVFFEEYVKVLERVSEPAYLDELLAEYEDELKRNSTLLIGEFADSVFSSEVLYQNQRFIKKVLNPVQGLQPHFREATDGYLELEMGNIQSIPVEVLGVSYQDTVQFRPDEESILPDRPVSYFDALSGKQFQSPGVVDYQTVRFKFPEGFVWSDEMTRELTVRYKLLGTTQTREEAVIPWSYLGDDFVENDFFRQEYDLSDYEFLEVDDATQRILIRPGTWHLDRSLIIPHGYQVIAGEGTILDLSDSATILSYSPLQFVGSEDEPIVIQSTSSTGQGLVVMGADQDSVLQHVIFSNLSSPSQSGWELTGAVTFYESPVAISHSQFVDSPSEDALNIVRSAFSIDWTIFSESSSDALDADFSKGWIKNSFFENIGNDAIDTSGSVIEIEDVVINRASDKGLSAGERSQITIDGLNIEDGQVAIASKDLSLVTAKNVSVLNGAIGLATYQKKSEFGPGTMEVVGLEMQNVDTPYLVEEHSRLVVDGTEIHTDQENTNEILATIK
jgi:hypothetical protein